MNEVIIKNNNSISTIYKTIEFRVFDVRIHLDKLIQKVLGIDLSWDHCIQEYEKESLLCNVNSKNILHDLKEIKEYVVLCYTPYKELKDKKLKDKAKITIINSIKKLICLTKCYGNRDILENELIVAWFYALESYSLATIESILENYWRKNKDLPAFAELREDLDISQKYNTIFLNNVNLLVGDSNA